MMNLLKYDVKRNANKLLGVGAVLVIVQALILFFIKLLEMKFALSLVSYIVAVVILFMTIFKTYGFNIKSYHRRLTPVKSISYVMSPLLLAWIGLLILAVLVSLQIYIYNSLYPEFNEAWIQIIDRFFSLSQLARIMLEAWWAITFSLLLVFVAVTISYSIPMRGRVWIGIVSFFAIANLISWLEALLFSKEGIFSIETKSTEFTQGQLQVTPGDQIFSSGSVVLFELIIAVIFIFVIVKLLDRRVEV